MRQEKITFEHLVAYTSGELGACDAAMVEAYLADLPEAARTARRLHEVMSTLRADDTVPATADAVRRALATSSPFATPAPDWLAPLRLIARLVFDSRAQLAVAGYRGGAARYQLAYESEPVRLDLQVLPRERSAGDAWRLRGQVTVHRDAQLGEVALLAERTETLVATAIPDHLGRFKIDSPSGVYDLRIELDDGTRSIVAPRLEIGPEFV